MVSIYPRLRNVVLTYIIGYPEPDEAPRNFFRLKNGEDFEIVFDRVLLFLEQLFIAVKSEVEKLSKKGKIPLPKLWYDNLLEKNNRQNLYLNVVAATEVSHNLMSMAVMKLIVA